MQRQASIEDQMALCRDLAAKLGATVVAEYSDAGISGFGVGSAAATPP
jgi:hypothetical protein